MTQIVGFRRDGHRYTITVTGRAGTASVGRVHRADCPCHTHPATPAALPARTLRRRKPTRH